MRSLVVTALLVVLVGCGGESSTDEPAPTSLKDACAQIASELPAAAVPEAPLWGDYLRFLDNLAFEGDQDVDNVVALLKDPVIALAADPPAGAELLAARSDLREALDQANEACKVAGSPALS